MQTHRCPATVSGSKSAETTEVLCLGKAESRECREPGDLPYMALRRPFEGKGAAACVPTPTVPGWGFFTCCFPCRVEQPSFPPCGGRGGGGSKPWFLPQRCFPLSSIPSPKRRATCAGVARQRAGAPVHVTSPQCVRIHTPVRISGGVSRQEGGEEHDLRDCGTLH